MSSPHPVPPIALGHPGNANSAPRMVAAACWIGDVAGPAAAGQAESRSPARAGTCPCPYPPHMLRGMPDSTPALTLTPPSRHRGDPGGRLGCLRRRRQPLRQPRLPRGAGGERQRQRPHRLAAAARRAARRWRPAARLRALLREEPQPGRIRLRLWLGRCLRAGRRQLLPEAAGLRAVQPGARPAAAVRPGAGIRADGARRRGWRRPAASSTCPPSMSPSAQEAEWEALGEAGWLQRHGHAVPLAQPRLCQLRRFPRRAVVPQAQGDQARAARRRGLRLRAEDAARARDHAERTGRPSTASTAAPRTRNGAAAPT